MQFQNCGEFKSSQTAGDTQVNSSKLREYQELEVESVEYKVNYGDSGKFYSRVTITFGNSGAFYALDESGVCTVSLSLSLDDSLKLRQLFDNVTTKAKSTSFENSDFQHPELTITHPGKAPQTIYVVSPTEEAGLQPGALILNERTQFLALMTPYLKRTWDPSQVICSVPDQIPQFVEYIFTDVVNNVTVAREAFLLEHRVSSAFISLPDAQTCFQGFTLTLAERAMALKASTVVQVTQKVGPVNGTFLGLQYIHYWFPPATTPTQYFIDPNRAADGQRILTNGAAVIEELLFIAGIAEARYQVESKTPSPIMERDPNNPAQQRQRCIVR